MCYVHYLWTVSVPYVFGYKGMAIPHATQSPVRGILHTINMVCRLPSEGDCGTRHIGVPLHRNKQQQRTMAQIYVNGDAQEVALPLTVTDVVRQNNVTQPEMVSVQVNEEFAEREDWDTIQLKDGDKVDFLYFMGGGTVRTKSE